MTFVRERRLPCAYAVPLIGSAQRAASVRRSLEALDIHSIGRYGEWKYANMEDALIDGRAAADRLIGDVAPELRMSLGARALTIVLVTLVDGVLRPTLPEARRPREIVARPNGSAGRTSACRPVPRRTGAVRRPAPRLVLLATVLPPLGRTTTRSPLDRHGVRPRDRAVR